jgi:hypothetical protein
VPTWRHGRDELSFANTDRALVHVATAKLHLNNRTSSSSRRPLEINLQKSCNEASTTPIPSNHDGIDESFVLTLCRRETPGNTYWIRQKVFHCQETVRLKVNLQFRHSPTTPEQQQTRRRQSDQSCSFERAKECEVAQKGGLLRLDFGRSWFDLVAAVSRRSSYRNPHASKILC